MLDVTTEADELNALVLSGKAMEGFEKFYAENVSMQENSDPPTVGKDANRKREEDFYSTVEDFHGAELRATATNGDVDFSEWMLDLTLKGVGRIKMEQIAVRRWENGQIVSERFYYNQA